MEFSHKWVNQVLVQRGIPSPGLEKIQACIAGADQGDKLRLYEVTQRMERGTDCEDDWDWMLSTLKRAQTVFVPAPESKPAAVRPIKKVAHRIESPLAIEHALPKKEVFADTKIRRSKHHIYGLKAALTVELDELRDRGDGIGVMHTVILEAAPSTGHRSYDWRNKIAFQFMRRELPLLACALLGMLDRPLELGNHGADANKFVLITDQGEKLLVQVKQGARSIAVPVGAPDVHSWLELVMQALAANAPSMGESIQLAALSRVAGMENKRLDKPKKIAA